MIRVIDSFSDYIKDYQIIRYNVVGSSYELILNIVFKDLSELHVSDYAFLDGNRKYTFHYQNKNSDLIFRHDTAPHYSHLSTFPYHKHLFDGSVICSNIMYLEKMLEEIVEQFLKK